MTGVFLRQLASALDPDVWLDAVQLVTSKGYPCEEHSVMTEDGYTLKMQRIPYGYDGPPKSQYTSIAYAVSKGFGIQRGTLVFK